MNTPECKFCSNSFHKKNNEPFLLIKCGHTICNDCLTKGFEDSNSFICKFDDTIYESNERKNFPWNQEVLKLLATKKEKCSKHEKPLEYYCLEECSEVC